MSVITRVPEPNIWEEVCKEFTCRRPSFQEDDVQSVKTDYSDYDPSRHNPVFYGRLHERVDVDVDILTEIDSAVSHPACTGFTFTDKPPPASPLPPPTPPDKKLCAPRVYLEHYVFPILLPCLEAMLKAAKEEKCFVIDISCQSNDFYHLEWKRTKFNALDFITEYLYRHNSGFTDRKDVILWDIPFVKDWLVDHPRPPLPMSLIWTEEEATLIIQSHWRGYLRPENWPPREPANTRLCLSTTRAVLDIVQNKIFTSLVQNVVEIRRDPEIQELRVWQKEWREINRGIHSRVSAFWDKQMPDWDQPTPNESEELAAQDEPVPAPLPVPSPLTSPSPVQSPATSPVASQNDETEKKDV